MRSSGPVIVSRHFLTLGFVVLLCLFGCDKRETQVVAEKGAPENARQQDSPAGAKKKVLFINSYHQGYQWSDGIAHAIFDFFHIPSGEIAEKGEAVGDVRLKAVYLDSKRQPSEQYLQQKGLEFKGLIEAWHPDVVITSDDNAAKYIIAPYFRGHAIPFVFCGINWDSSEYGLPTTNVTGMLEVQLLDEILDHLRQLAAGPRIGYLKGDDMSARKEAAFFEKRFGIHLDKRFVGNFAQWQQEYLALQEDTDILLLGNTASISDWNPAKAKVVVSQHTRIPSGNWDLWMAPYALMTFATKPEEQGYWAARTAAEILAGKEPSTIAVVQNVVAHVVLNMQLAKQMNVKFPANLVEQAVFVESNQ